MRRRCQRAAATRCCAPSTARVAGRWAQARQAKLAIAPVAGRLGGARAAGGARRRVATGWGSAEEGRERGRPWRDRVRRRIQAVVAAVPAPARRRTGRGVRARGPRRRGRCRLRRPRGVAEEVGGIGRRCGHQRVRQRARAGQAERRGGGPGVDEHPGGDGHLDQRRLPGVEPDVAGVELRLRRRHRVQRRRRRPSTPSSTPSTTPAASTAARSTP